MGLNKLLTWIDRHLGRGSYGHVRRWVDPRRIGSQRVYGGLLSQLMHRDVRWLDAGCGHQVLEIGPNNPEKELASQARLAVGCDGDFGAISKHRSLLNRVACRLEALPFHDSCFDLITLNNVVEHFGDPVPTLAECARILAADGQLVILTPNARSYFVRWAGLGRRFLGDRMATSLLRYLEHREQADIYPTHYRVNTRSDLAKVANAAGLEVESLELVLCQPFFYFVPLLAALELVATRLLARLGFNEIAGEVILARLKQQSRAPSTRPGAVHEEHRAFGSKLSGFGAPAARRTPWGARQ